MAAFIPIAGAAFGVLGALSSAGAERKAANFNAAAAERNATISQQQAAADAQTIGRQARQRIGAMRASYGAAGVAIEGSPLDMLEFSASEAEMDKANVIYKGSLAALGYNDSAALSRSKSDSAMSAGLFGAGRALLIGSNPDVPLVGVKETAKEKRERLDKEDALGRRVPMPRY